MPVPRRGEEAPNGAGGLPRVLPWGAVGRTGGPAMYPSDRKKLLEDVEAFCQEVRPHEELCYVEHRYNDQVIPLARKYNLLAIPVPVEYGGRGADTLIYVKA